MKKMIKFWICGIVALAIQSQVSFAQKIDDERMNRDIEVSENVLATLIKHEINQQRTFYGLDIKGAYQPGYGVTFRLPGDYAMPYVVSTSGQLSEAKSLIVDNGYTYTIRSGQHEEGEARSEKEKDTQKLKEKTKEKRKVSNDSLREAYHNKMIQAAKDFIVDYGDFLSQLAPNERIVVTNQGDNHYYYFNSGKRRRISVEGLRSDITAFKQGKISRDQALAKLTVVNTESIETKEADMELLSSIFNRLYNADLSKTYFTNGNVYYERLKDYGVIFYMQVFSSNGGEFNRYSLPTVGLDDVDKEARDKKVVELYPKFEQELKENIVEYGRTLKSLKDEELMVFNVTLTKCQGCGIPSSLELSVKGSVLKDFGSGKLDKSAAAAKFIVKKGAKQ